MTYVSTLGKYNIEMPDITVQVTEHIIAALDAKIQAVKKFTLPLANYATRYRITKPTNYYQYPGGPVKGFMTDSSQRPEASRSLWVDVGSTAGHAGSEYLGILSIGSANGEVRQTGRLDWTRPPEGYSTIRDTSGALFVKRADLVFKNQQRILGSSGLVQQYYGSRGTDDWRNVTLTNPRFPAGTHHATINSIYETLVLGGSLSKLLDKVGKVTGIVNLWVAGTNPFKVKPKWADLAGDTTKIDEEAANILNTLGESINNSKNYPIPSVVSWFYKFGLKVPQNY